MIEQRQNEFVELCCRATECLEHPTIALPHRRLLLRLWHYPSFDRHVSWSVYSPLPRCQSGALVYEVSWDRPYDLTRFSDPLKGIKHGFSIEPTLAFRQADVPGEELKLKLISLRGIVLPVFEDDGSIGLDGEDFGIETFGFKSSIRLRWWCESHDVWNPIVKWAKDMRQFLSMCLERTSLTSNAI